MALCQSKLYLMYKYGIRELDNMKVFNNDFEFILQGKRWKKISDWLGLTFKNKTVVVSSHVNAFIHIECVWKTNMSSDIKNNPHSNQALKKKTYSIDHPVGLWTCDLCENPKCSLQEYALSKKRISSSKLTHYYPLSHFNW